MEDKDVKFRLLKYLSDKKIINLNDFYVITIDDKIRLQGRLNANKRNKYEKVFNKKGVLEDLNWLKITTKNFVVTLTF